MLVRARIESGRIIIDEAVDLPDGEAWVNVATGEVETEEEILAALEAGVAEAEQGRLVPAQTVLERIRRA